MKKKLGMTVLVVAVCSIGALNLKVMMDSNCTSSALALSTVKAVGESNSDIECSYNRHDFQCTVEGNGKIEIFKLGVTTIKGSLIFDGGLYCTGGGNESCKDIECVDLYSWIKRD